MNRSVLPVFQNALLLIERLKVLPEKQRETFVDKQ